MTGNDEGRAIELEVTVAGTPEQVWEAIATGPGITAWFVPTTVEGEPGGVITQDFGPGMLVEGRVQAGTAARFSYGEQAEPTPGTMAFEFLGRGPGRQHLRRPAGEQRFRLRRGVGRPVRRHRERLADLLHILPTHHATSPGSRPPG
ncbi:MAG: hypothetical protein R2719_15015 [Micropruina sp.]